MSHDERLKNVAFDLANQRNAQTNDCSGNNALGCKSNDHGKDHRCWSTNKRNEGTDENQNSQRRSYGDSQYLQEDGCK